MRKRTISQPAGAQHLLNLPQPVLAEIAACCASDAQALGIVCMTCNALDEIVVLHFEVLWKLATHARFPWTRVSPALPESSFPALFQRELDARVLECKRFCHLSSKWPAPSWWPAPPPTTTADEWLFTLKLVRTTVACPVCGTQLATAQLGAVPVCTCGVVLHMVAATEEQRTVWCWEGLVDDLLECPAPPQLCDDGSDADADVAAHLLRMYVTRRACGRCRMLYEGAVDDSDGGDIFWQSCSFVDTLRNEPVSAQVLDALFAARAAAPLPLLTTAEGPPYIDFDHSLCPRQWGLEPVCMPWFSLCERKIKIELKIEPAENVDIDVLCDLSLRDLLVILERCVEW